MNISLFTIVMTIFWGSLLIVFFYLLRKKLYVLEVCNISGIVAIYLFSALRLFLPVEFPWTKVIHGGILWNGLQRMIRYELCSVSGVSIIFGHLLGFVWGAVAIYSSRNPKKVHSYSKTRLFERRASLYLVT